MDQMFPRNTPRLLIALIVSGLLAGVAAAQAPKSAAPALAPVTTPASAASKPAAPAAEVPEAPNKVVLKVGDQQFTRADIDSLIAHLDPRTQSAIAARGRKPLGDQYAMMILLSQRARAHHLDENPDFIQKLALQKTQMEAQAAYEEINQQTKIEPEDIQKYYDTHTSDYDEITVRQIVIRIRPQVPPITSASSVPPAGPGLSQEEAKTRAGAIRKEILAGTDIKKVTEDFKAPGVVIIEPEPRVIRRTNMRPDLAQIAFGLKDGEVSEPVDIPQALVMFQVTAHNHIDLKTATPDIEKTLRPQKIEAAIAEVKKSTPVWMDAQYFTAPAGAPEPPRMGAPGTSTPPKP